MVGPGVGSCSSCGDDRAALVAVRRIYLVWSDDGEPIDERTVEEPEAWCPACLTQYPHEPA